jgi:transposase
MNAVRLQCRRAKVTREEVVMKATWDCSDCGKNGTWEPDGLSSGGRMQWKFKCEGCGHEAHTWGQLIDGKEPFHE